MSKVGCRRYSSTSCSTLPSESVGTEAGKLLNMRLRLAGGGALLLCGATGVEGPPRATLLFMMDATYVAFPKVHQARRKLGSKEVANW